AGRRLRRGGGLLRERAAAQGQGDKGRIQAQSVHRSVSGCRAVECTRPSRLAAAGREAGYGRGFRYPDGHVAPPACVLTRACPAGNRKPMSLTLLLGLTVIIVLAAVLAWTIVVFNRLVRLRNQVRTAWADIDVQLLRRHDLVPMLVSAVQAYAGHERAVLEAVTSLRAQALAEASRPQLAQVEQALEQALGRLFALQAAYPDLKASGNFAQLQRDLVEVEEHLQFARRFYNGAVRDYNDATQRVPDLLVARAAGFDSEDFFEAGDGQRAAVRVDLP